MSVLAEAEVVNELPISATWFGIVALIVFATLLALTYSFRGVSHRHAPEAMESRAGSTGGSGSGGH